MSWMSNRFARMRRVPKQQGAHARGVGVPAPRAASDRLPSLTVPTDPAPPALAVASVLVSARDDDVRYLLTRRCEMSAHLQVVAEAKEPVASLRAAHRLRPDLIVVQVHSAKESEAELITAFKELSPTSKVFAYSTLPGGAAVSAAVAAGADRYALAGSPLTALLREIEALAVPAVVAEQ